MKWNSKDSVFYDHGRRKYSCGDNLPDTIIDQMGEATVNEYIDRGFIIKEHAEESKEDVHTNLLQQAKDLGLKPHHKTGISKLKKMIAEASK